MMPVIQRQHFSWPESVRRFARLYNACVTFITLHVCRIA